eukprot:682103-Rhodomonas_salina.1
MDGRSVAGCGPLCRNLARGCAHSQPASVLQNSKFPTRTSPSDGGTSFGSPTWSVQLQMVRPCSLPLRGGGTLEANASSAPLQTSDADPKEANRTPEKGWESLSNFLDRVVQNITTGPDRHHLPRRSHTPYSLLAVHCRIKKENVISSFNDVRKALTDETFVSALAHDLQGLGGYDEGGRCALELANVSLNALATMSGKVNNASISGWIAPQCPFSVHPRVLANQVGCSTWGWRLACVPGVLLTFLVLLLVALQWRGVVDNLPFRDEETVPLEALQGGFEEVVQAAMEGWAAEEEREREEKRKAENPWEAMLEARGDDDDGEGEGAEESEKSED